MEHVKKDLPALFIGAGEQGVLEDSLYPTAFFNDILSLFRAEQQDFATVTRGFSALQIAFLHQLIHIDGDEVRLDSANLHHITGGPVFRIVAKEHENVKSGLGQFQLLAQWFAHGIVSQIELPDKFNVGIHRVQLLPATI